MEDKKKTDESEKKIAEGKRRTLLAARRARRQKQRKDAKAQGHKLGSKNRKCKICGATKISEGFNGMLALAAACPGEAPVGR